MLLIALPQAEKFQHCVIAICNILILLAMLYSLLYICDGLASNCGRVLTMSSTKTFG